MANAAVKYQYKPNNIIMFEDFKNMRNGNTPEPVVKDDDKINKASEVYAFRTDEEIKAMIDVFNKHIEDAPDDDKRRIAWRNLMIFVIGCNTALRASDLRLLTWEFFFHQDGSFKDSYKIKPQKTRRYNKYVTIHFNDAIKTVINNYLAEYPYESLNEYVFASREGDNQPIVVRSIWRIIKNAAREAGLPQNIGSHSLRKSFCFNVYRNAKDKQNALVVLQQILNHSDQMTTMRYIGLMNEEIGDVFNSVNLGLDWL